MMFGYFSYHYSSSEIPRTPLCDKDWNWQSSDRRVALSFQSSGEFGVIDICDRSQAGQPERMAAVIGAVPLTGSKAAQVGPAGRLLELIDAGIEQPILSLANEIIGSFSAILWDGSASVLTLAQDRSGTQPFFVADDGWNCFFGTNSDAIAEASVQHLSNSAHSASANHQPGQLIRTKDAVSASNRQDVLIVPPESLIKIDGLGCNFPIALTSEPAHFEQPLVPGDLVDVFKDVPLDETAFVPTGQMAGFCLLSAAAKALSGNERRLPPTVIDIRNACSQRISKQVISPIIAHARDLGFDCIPVSTRHTPTRPTSARVAKSQPIAIEFLEAFRAAIDTAKAHGKSLIVTDLCHRPTNLGKSSGWISRLLNGESRLPSEGRGLMSSQVQAESESGMPTRPIVDEKLARGRIDLEPAWRMAQTIAASTADGVRFWSPGLATRCGGFDWTEAAETLSRRFEASAVSLHSRFDQAAE